MPGPAARAAPPGPTSPVESQVAAWPRSLAEQLRLIGVDPTSLSADNISRSVALRSPIHGWVAQVRVNIGRYVQPTDVLFELVDPKDIHLALTLFEKDLPLVRVGQEVHARPTARPEEEYEAEVILVGRSLDADRSTVVHCHFTKTPKDLVPGMAMSATEMERKVSQLDNDVSEIYTMIAPARGARLSARTRLAPCGG